MLKIYDFQPIVQCLLPYALQLYTVCHVTMLPIAVFGMQDFDVAKI